MKYLISNVHLLKFWLHMSLSEKRYSIDPIQKCCTAWTVKFLFHQFISVNQMVACSIILVSMVVLQLSIGVEPSIWGTKTTEFASDKKKVFETFAYTEKAICFSKKNSSRIFHDCMSQEEFWLRFVYWISFFLVLKCRSCVNLINSLKIILPHLLTQFNFLVCKA